MPLIYRFVVAFLRTHPDDLIHGTDEDLSIPHLAGMRGGDDGVYHPVYMGILDDHRNLHLGQQVDLVGPSPPLVFYATLRATSLDLDDGHADTADILKRMLDVLQLFRAYDCFYFFHGITLFPYEFGVCVSSEFHSVEAAYFHRLRDPHTNHAVQHLAKHEHQGEDEGECRHDTRELCSKQAE